MKNAYTFIFASLFFTNISFSQNDVDVSASDNWFGFMNVFNLGGGYEFGSFWGMADLKTTLDAVNNTITLQPNFNTYQNAIDSGIQSEIDFWTDGSGGGNKICDANTLVEPGPTYNDVALTFHGSVISTTLDTSIYTAYFFIQAIDSTNNYQDALGQTKVFELPHDGPFSVSVDATDIPSGLIVQYGFRVSGINANPADEIALGSVVIGIEGAGIEANSSAVLSAYPNPVENTLHLETSEKISSYSIYSVSGAEVSNGFHGESIDVSELEKGMYFVKMQFADREETISFMKK